MDRRRVSVQDPARVARRLRASVLLRRLANAAAPNPLYLTGGALRDRLLGVATSDLDLVVEGDAEVVIRRLAAHLGGSVIPLGTPPRVTWRLACRRWHVDVLGIQPGGLRRDVIRRDYTVNAIVWRLPKGPLLDLTGGLDDLAAGRLSVIDPRNLRDDPLRVVRGLRLIATRPALSLTAETERQLVAAREGLAGVAAERITAELRMLLAGPGVRRAVRAAWRLGVLAVLHPSWRTVAAMDELLEVAGRLAALGGRAGPLRAGAATAALAVLAAPAAGFPGAWHESPASQALCAFGFAPRTARQAALAAAVGESLAPRLNSQDRDTRALAVEHLGLLPAALAWAVARRGNGEAEARSLLRWARRFARRPPLLRGDQVAALLSVTPGPAVAEAVRLLQRARARGEVCTRAQAQRWLVQRVDPRVKPLLE